MPPPLRHSQETHTHLMGVYRRLLLTEATASKARQRRPPVTLQSLLAAAEEHRLERLAGPLPVSQPTARVQACLSFLADTGTERLGSFFTSPRALDSSVEILALSPSQLLKERFNDDSDRMLWLGAALWYGRRAFEWVHERSTEGLLGHFTAFRDLTVQAIGLSMRYELRDGFQPYAFLPRDPAIAEALESSEQAQMYLDWSVDYDSRSLLVRGGADHWGNVDR